jgi:AraC-like DNA-binding protein
LPAFSFNISTRSFAVSIYRTADREQITLLPIKIFAMNNRKVKSYDIESIMRAREIIDSNPGRRMTITALALDVDLNPIKLQEGFHELFGQTIHRYRLDLRLTHAVELMLQTDLTIAEIAYKIGFNSRDVFARDFKKKFSISPRTWRKEQKNTAA